MRGLADSRIRTVLYSPDEVYRLYGFVGYHLDLEFASDEVFVGLSAGDPEARDLQRPRECPDAAPQSREFADESDGLHQ